MPKCGTLQLDAASRREATRLRTRLDDDEYRPRLSGHETFPLRYGWLKKAFDAAVEEQRCGTQLFSAESAIARFGVGKNMVSSIRHWAVSAQILLEDDGSRSLRPSPLGTLLFDETCGLDPWMENASSSWLVHWNVSGHERLTTWFWAFSLYPAITFEREALVRGVKEFADRRGWSRASLATIKRDVACLVRTYSASHLSGTPLLEDAIESPLSELGLVRPTGARDGFRFARGPKPSMRPGVFGYAVNDYWSRCFPSSSTLSFEALAHGPGSPGRVFLLGENDVVEMLLRLEDTTDGAYRWSETAGLRQLIRLREIPPAQALQLVKRDYAGVSQ